MRFAKYQGTGNDFIVLDRRNTGSEGPLPGITAARLCDRHTGIGADGVLTLWPASDADFAMQVQNADGSESDMCGNGLRCVARFVHDSNAKAPGILRVRAGGQVYVVERHGVGYRVSMGRPSTEATSLPPEAHGRTAFTLAAGEARFDAVALSFGNPHAIIFTPEEPMQLAITHGPILERHPSFPERVNVSFARAVAPQVFETVVFERGSGITQACGSGACAVGVAAVWSGRAERDSEVEVRLPGGSLRITVDPTDQVVMQGDAAHVYSGEVDTLRFR
jgi:diaminopimelate epimerase